MKTIAQISTPIGSGGVAIIRMSGEQSLKIAFEVFSAKKLTASNIEPRKMYLGTFHNQTFDEKCLMVYFKAPFSFTGEDVVEFQIHGGVRLAQVCLNTLLAHGATLAENGEFSRLAFMNGKMSLDEAEGMIDMINATSDAELKTASELSKGRLFKVVKSIQEKIKQALVDIEVTIDYPEHDDEVMTIGQIKQMLISAKQEVQKLIDSQKVGSSIKEGVDVAIVGKPNVGKSSLLNSLIGQERAIVTSVKGTTRDVLKETITYKGVKINFLDTAGVRQSDDIVEKIGIERSLESIENCDIVLCVLDGSEKLTDEDYDILQKVKNHKTLYIINKADLSKQVELDGAINVSAKEHFNVDEIKEQILKMLELENIDYNQVIITNLRHGQILEQANQKFDEVIELCSDETADIVDMELKLLWKILGKITGESETEQIITSIFAKFCLGK